MVEVELKEWGDSLGVIMPAEKLKELGLHKGDKIEIDIVQKKRMEGFGICNGAKPFEEEKEVTFLSVLEKTWNSKEDGIWDTV